MDDNRNADQVNKAADEAKGRLAAATETVSDLTGKAGTAAADAASTIQGAASETAKQVSDAAAKTYRQGAQAAEYLSHKVFDRIHVFRRDAV
jgi:ABC-type transporter Mla subunit MlaD